MNPLTNVRNVKKLSEQELYTSNKTSWHDQYKDSAWIFIAGYPYELTEGDIICIFSQYGEIVHINLIRDKDTGKSKGYCFLCYEDQRSTVLAVDNFNGIKIFNRTLRVDHVANYKIPKHVKDDATNVYPEGYEPNTIVKVERVEEPKEDLRETLADQINSDLKLPQRLPIYSNIKEEKSDDLTQDKGKKKSRKDKKHKKKGKKRKKDLYSDSNSESSSDDDCDIKNEKNHKSNKNKR